MSWGTESMRQEMASKGMLRRDERMGTLAAALLVLNREEDIWKAATDVDFREKLYKEFGLDYSA